MSTQKPPAAERARNPVAALRRFMRPRPPKEMCELCGLELTPEHPHLLEPTKRQIVCACDACAILFSGQQNGRFRRIPRDVQSLPDFRMTDVQWEALAIPISLAFFFRNSAADRVVALYPSPGGAIESQLTLDAWQELAADNPVLQELEPDVEALLVNRVSEARDYYRAPIDECYRLVGLIRAHWSGLSGGDAVGEEIARFFAGLKGEAMKTLVKEIADAVLYEGYILYPYRPSVKNRQRWTFGGLYPEAYRRAHGDSEPCLMRTECLVIGNEQTRLTVQVRFLQLRQRFIGELEEPVTEWPCAGEPRHRRVEALQVGEQVLQTWQEAVEREVGLAQMRLGEIAARPWLGPFAFPAGRESEPLRAPDGTFVGLIVREQQGIEGRVELGAESLGEGIFRLAVVVRNETALSLDPRAAAGRLETRDEALLCSFVSTHAVLSVRDGEFVSLTDPPDELREMTDGCQNVGAWPVLVGEEGERNTMLASPIILSDYPQVAPESPGGLFDSTEIDEILSLRILTLTDEEKRAAAAVDPRVHALLERTESLTRDQLMRLHGTIRGLRPVREEMS